MGHPSLVSFIFDFYFLRLKISSKKSHLVYLEFISLAECFALFSILCRKHGEWCQLWFDFVCLFVSFGRCASFHRGIYFSISRLLSVFIMQQLLNFVKFFFSINWCRLCDVFPLVVNMVDYLHWYLNVESTLHSWDESHLIVIYYSFLYIACCVRFASILLRIFCLWSWGTFVCNFLFCVILFRFCY